jgi:hypothetical protein
MRFLCTFCIFQTFGIFHNLIKDFFFRLGRDGEKRRRGEDKRGEERKVLLSLGVKEKSHRKSV